MKAWKTLARQALLEHSKFLSIERHTIELGNGQVITDWPWVVTPDFTNVVAVTEAGEFICFRQTKYAVEGTTLSIPGGYIEPGEDPLETAKRELLEETGYEAAAWDALGAYAVDGNRGAGRAHFFLARGARRVAEPDADDLEEQELLLLSRERLEAALHAGQFKVLPWMSTVALALTRLRR